MTMRQARLDLARKSQQALETQDLLRLLNRYDVYAIYALRGTRATHHGYKIDEENS